jgi:hypothetical protein
VTEQERVDRIVAAIEDTPEAIDARSRALELFHDDPARNIDEIWDLCKDAAAAVLVHHPELPRSETRFLAQYIASQVRALGTGEPATLLLQDQRLN